MKKLVTTALLLGLVAGAGWFYLTPHFALMRIRSAAEAGDAGALRDLVDFPAVRQSLKDEARDAIGDELAGRSGSDALGSVGAFLAGQVVDRAVDIAVQPEGIAALTRGVRPGATQRPGSGGGRIDPNVRAERGYEGVDRFVVAFRDRDSGEHRVALVLEREGLIGWKLAGVRLGAE